MANIIRTGGGGSGGSATLITKSITQNGTYLATDDNADGYSEVEVDVVGREIDKVYFQNTSSTGATPLTITLLETANKTSHIRLTGSVWAPSIPTGYTATTGTISNNNFTTTETSAYHWDYVQEFDITCGVDNAVIVYNGGLNNMSEVSLNVYHIYNLASKTITQNGTYNASTDSADGYSSVVVNVSGNGLTPVSWDDETHNVQQNRTITVNGYNLNANISAQNYSVGILSMPIIMPAETNGLLLCYDLVGASYTDENYYPTIFCSDTQMSGITDKTSSYGNKQLVQQSLSSGQSVTGLIESLNIPSNSFFFNIQFGVSNFENIRLYAVKI